MADIRKLIIEHMKKKGISRYAVAKALEASGKASQTTVYMFLRGDVDSKWSAISAILDFIGADVSLAAHAAHAEPAKPAKPAKPRRPKRRPRAR